MIETSTECKPGISKFILAKLVIEALVQLERAGCAAEADIEPIHKLGDMLRAVIDHAEHDKVEPHVKRGYLKILEGVTLAMERDADSVGEIRNFSLELAERFMRFDVANRTEATDLATACLALHRELLTAVRYHRASHSWTAMIRPTHAAGPDARTRH